MKNKQIKMNKEKLITCIEYALGDSKNPMDLTIDDIETIRYVCNEETAQAVLKFKHEEEEYIDAIFDDRCPRCFKRFYKRRVSSGIGFFGICYVCKYDSKNYFPTKASATHNPKHQRHTIRSAPATQSE